VREVNHYLKKILPQESESQEIGKQAARALYSRLPNNWTEKNLDGDTDFGLDYQVQLKDERNFITASFYLQLKGTTTPTFVDNGSAISQPFKCSTLNYYRQQEAAVMVAVADLSVSEKPRECPVYFKWLDEEFLDTLSKGIETNSTVNIRIPIQSQITESLDVLPFYKSRLASRECLIGLRRAVEKHSANPAEKIKGLAQAIEEKPIFLEVISDDSGAPWVMNPSDHVIGKLSRVSDAIKVNNILLARELLKEVESQTALSDHITAEFLYQSASIECLVGNEVEACEKYKRAYDIFPKSRYKIGYYESTFRKEDPPFPNELEEYIANLAGVRFGEAVLKAKCLALLGREDEAIAELAAHPKKKTQITKLVVYVLSGNHDEFERAASVIKVEELEERQALTFRMLTARRTFFKGINFSASLGKDAIIPAKGKGEYDFDLLRTALADVEIAFELAKSQGYPYEIVLLLDIAVLLYSFFDREDVLIKRLQSILDARPASKSIVSALAPMLFNARRYEEAIDVLETFSYKSLDQVSLLIFAQYHVGSKLLVLRLVDEYRESILTKKPQNYEVLFCIAAQCASETLHEEKEREYLDLVGKFGNSEKLLAIYEYVKSCTENPAKRKANNQLLYAKFVALENSPEIAAQLFPYLDVNDPLEAAQMCDLASSIQSERELYPEECVMFGFALSACDRWEELESLCERVEARGELSDLWSLLKASALDGLGRSKQALDLLDSSVSRDRRSYERGENYVRLCVRLGFFEKAAAKLESLLEKSTSDKQMSVLESLLFIYSADEEPSSRLIPALIRFGKMVDQGDEIEEGRFLLSFFTMANRQGLAIEGHVNEFRERLDRYTLNFPASKLIRKGTIKGGSGSEQTIRTLQELSGISDDQLKEWEKNRNLIRTGRLPVPFAMLPAFLSDAGDLFSAWSLNKHFRRTRREYQLAHSRMMSESDFSSLKSKGGKFVLDETSLLVLNELNLLEKLCSTNNKIVVSRATYEEFSRASHWILGSVCSSIPKNILKVLGNYLEHVELLGDAKPGGSIIERYEHLLAEVDSAFLCTDDAVLSEFLRVDGKKTFNSTNVIDYLYEDGQLSDADRTRAIEQLSSLGLRNTAIAQNHVSGSLWFNQEWRGDRQIMQTGFREVFDAVFEEHLEARVSIERLSTLFSHYLNQNASDGRTDDLQDLVDRWLIRNPVNTRVELVSIWFVLTCISIEYVPESDFVIRGKGESKLWEITKQLTLEREPSLTLYGLLSVISSKILLLKPELASDAYDRIKRSFMDESNESEVFVRAYVDNAIPLRAKDFGPE